MGRKSRAKEILPASINVKCDYTAKDGIVEMKEVSVQGSTAILVSMCFALLKTLCQQANVKYTELLSQEIKNTVTKELFERTEAMREQERQQREKEKEENGK